MIRSVLLYTTMITILMCFIEVFLSIWFWSSQWFLSAIVTGVLALFLSVATTLVVFDKIKESDDLVKILTFKDES